MSWCRIRSPAAWATTPRNAARVREPASAPTAPPVATCSETITRARFCRLAGYHARRGAVAEWLGRGLQSLVQRFDSARRLFSQGLVPRAPGHVADALLEPVAPARAGTAA